MARISDKLLNSLINSVMKHSPAAIRNNFACSLGISSSKDTRFMSNVYFENYKKVHLGKACFVNHFVKFYTGTYNDSEIVIGKNVYIGMDTKIITNSHSIGDAEQRASECIAKSIEIADGCWIGANVLLLPGAKLEKGCLIAAGAVVVGICEENSLYGGVPAKLIRRL
jgi:hypothetical protein